MPLNRPGVSGRLTTNHPFLRIGLRFPRTKSNQRSSDPAGHLSGLVRIPTPDNYRQLHSAWATGKGLPMVREPLGSCFCANWYDFWVMKSADDWRCKHWQCGMGGFPTFACYREQNQATLSRNIVGHQVFNQLDVPFVSFFSVGNQTFEAGYVNHGTTANRKYTPGRSKKDRFVR